MRNLGWRTTPNTPGMIGEELVAHLLPLRTVATLSRRSTPGILLSPYLCKMLDTVANALPVHQVDASPVGTWTGWMMGHLSYRSSVTISTRNDSRMSSRIKAI